MIILHNFAQSESRDSLRELGYSRSQSWGAGSTGRLSASSSQISGAGAPMMRVIARLWCHECTRVFGDRLLSDDGRNCSILSLPNAQLAADHKVLQKQPRLNIIESRANPGHPM